MTVVIDSARLSPTTSSPHPLTTHLTSISLHNFRNYTHARVETTSAPVILTGSNGAGKTSLLEAISLLTPGRGLRRAKLSELDRTSPSPIRGEGGEGGATWVVSARVFGMQGDVQIGTGRNPDCPPPNLPPSGGGDSRIVKIDGKISRGQSELARHLSVIWLTPQMEQLFQDGTSAGRKFLDRLVYSFDPEHASRINEYEFAMRERNKLLQNPRADHVWLDALEQTMAETGAAIANARLHTVEHINDAIHRSTLSFPKADIKIRGIIEDKLHQGIPAIQAEDEFKSILKAGRGQDSAAGRTLIGTHRSEMQVIHIIKQMPAESCSTGEQKALLLSIVLAQARAGAQWHGVVPVLLLDEVVAHLDATRRLELFEEICQIGAQTWMTGTDAALFTGMEQKAQFFRVDNGSVIPA